MIVWGGIAGILANTGEQYDTVGDSWTSTTTTGGPTGRQLHTALWTGAKMIIWGGSNGGAKNNTRGVYDPVGDSWLATANARAPTGRPLHTAVWDRAQMNFCGWLGSTCHKTPARYR